MRYIAAQPPRDIQPMRHPRQPGLFDIEERGAQLTEMGDPLVGLNARIDWEAFRSDLNRVHEKDRKSKAGAKPFDVVLMFKVLVLQQLHNLSDDKIEYQLRDRFSFMRFLGLQLEDRVPDAKTVWLFRERLKGLNLVDVLFARFHQQLAEEGYVARAGQMIDATFVEVPRQRNTREENVQIKAGEVPEAWDKPEAKAKRRQKDTEARWTKKNEEKHYGYKNHINADQQHKLIQSYAVTPASVHDSQVFDELLDQNEASDGNKRAVYADSAYRSQDQEQRLADARIDSQICEKGTRGKPLSEEQKQANRTKSKVRARVEHVFGAQAAMGGHLVRTIGLQRAKVKIGLMNLVYNMMRLVQLIKRDVKAVNRALMNNHREGAPIGV
jgi:transposase, IS5 family